MRKLILLAAIAISTFSVSAQTDQCQFMVGGMASFSASKYSDFYKSTSVTVSPNVGYFFINNLAGGLRVNLQSFTEKYDDEGKTTQTTVSVAPFVRYYFVSFAENKIKLFGDASVGFGSDKYKNDDDDTDKDNFTDFTVSVGPAFFLTPNTALEVAVGFNSNKYKDDDDATNSFGLNVGFQIHLGKKKK